jgi:hypothetical protein
LKKKSARAKSKKCGKIFQFWSPAWRDGGSGAISFDFLDFSLSVFLAASVPPNPTLAAARNSLVCCRKVNNLLNYSCSPTTKFFVRKLSVLSNRG